jgi:spermidine/putrescine transport system ATP-binding protein
VNGALDAAPAVQLVGIERRYGEIVAVRGIDLAIADGEFFSLLGPSGCGKTTTLRMISGLEEPTVGRVEVHGRDMTRVPPHRRPVTTVFQNYALFPHLDVFENVAFGLRERRVGRAEVRSRVARLLELVDLSGRDTARPRELSGGQQQRVALARSLVLNPEVLLLDEPLGALDLKLRKQLQDLLKAVQREVGITFVYVTHDQEEAFSMSDRVAVMNLGRVEQIGGPREVYARPSTLFVAQFVGASNHFPARVVDVLGAGRYRADLGALGTWPVTGVAGLAAGDEAVAIVRPEQVRASTGGGSERSGEIGVSGRIADVSFVGPATHLTIDTGVGTVRCVAPGRADGAETATRFHWDASDAWLVAPRPPVVPA